MDTVVLALGIPPDYARRREVYDELKAECAAGHARLRAAIAARIEREAIKRGRSHALLGMARRWLKYDDRTATAETAAECWARTKAQAVETLQELLDKLARNRAAVAAHESNPPGAPGTPQESRREDMPAGLAPGGASDAGRK